MLHTGSTYLLEFTIIFTFRLADLGNTIIFSIHQPRYSIFKLCDTLCLLGNGQTVYHGPANEAIKFFSSLGKL